MQFSFRSNPDPHFRNGIIAYYKSFKRILISFEVATDPKTVNCAFILCKRIVSATAAKTMREFHTSDDIYGDFDLCGMFKVTSECGGTKEGGFNFARKYPLHCRCRHKIQASIHLKKAFVALMAIGARIMVPNGGILVLPF